MANGYSIGTTGGIMPTTLNATGTGQVLNIQSSNVIIVNENTQNLEEIQSFPVVKREGNIHFHENPTSGQLYQMTDEFHSRIPQILSSRMNKSIFMNALSSNDVSNIMSDQMESISKSNYIRENSDTYVNNNIFTNTNANDMFFAAALNSSDTQGSFFYTNENSVYNKQSVIFDNQDILLNESIQTTSSPKTNILNSTYDNTVVVIDNTNNQDNKKGSVNIFNLNVYPNRYILPSLQSRGVSSNTSTQRNRTNTFSAVRSFGLYVPPSNRYVFPSFRR